MEYKPGAISIAYAEDHTMFREALTVQLNAMSNVYVQLTASNGCELLDGLNKEKIIPDVCLVDLNMPQMDGFELLQKLKKNWPYMKLIVLTMFNNQQYMVRAIACGANGYLLKSANIEELEAAINHLINNDFYYTKYTNARIVKEAKTEGIKQASLSATEISVLQYTGTEMTYAQIATTMGLSARSVEGYRDNLFRKLNVNSRTGLVIAAIQLGYLMVEQGEYDRSAL